MKTQTLNIPKASFSRLAQKAVQTSRKLRVIVRFTVGGRVFVASPKKSIHTLMWERELQVPSRRRNTINA